MLLSAPRALRCHSHRAAPSPPHIGQLRRSFRATEEAASETSR